MTEDRELLSQFVRDGSRTALSTLVERYRKMVYALCLRELSDPDDAADATQATFLLLQNSAAKIKRRERIGSWLYSAARHVCQNARRERMRRQRIEGVPLMDDLSLAQPPPVAGPDPEGVMAYFHRLPEKDRIALSLRFLNGMSVKEVGTSLGIAEQAAQMRVARALDRFRNILQGAGMSMAIIDLDRAMSNQLRWDAPEIHLAPKGEHRWSTKLKPQPGKTLLKVAGFGMGSMACFVVFAPVLLMAAFGQVPANLGGAVQVWRMMRDGISGADRATILTGVWSTETGPNGQARKIAIFQSANGEHVSISIGDSNMQGGMDVQRSGDDWRLNGVTATVEGAKDFQWDRGDLVLTANSDRNTERLTLHAEGLKLTLKHERGGSVRSLKPDQEELIATRDQTGTMTVPFR